MKSVWIEYLVTTVIALALALLYWWPLPLGGGLIGGDTYNYFFPLKDFYAQGLKAGELRLWHPGIGNGIPILGESQTGVFYPFYLLAYRFLDLNTAYTWVILGHYVLAYVFTYALARTVRLGTWGSHLAAVVFVYGWFPPRVCLEWAIVTGTWMPAIVACSLRWLDTGQRRYFWGTALALAMQLSAGHFNLAWITLLFTVVIILLWKTPQSGLTRRAGWMGAVALGFLLAAPQLVPSWELKTRSQRSKADFKQELEEGLLPIPYLAQMIRPWDIYPDADGTLARMGAKSNKVEAHLYFGSLPLAILVIGLLTGQTLGVGWRWLMAGAIFLFLATGIPIAWLADVPGFSFFRYCGRYAIGTQLSAAILAGLALDRFLPKTGGLRVVMGSVAIALSVADLYVVGHTVQYTTQVKPPIIAARNESLIFKMLSPTDRVLAPDGNTLALSGTACVPPYLGMGPTAYYEIWNRVPNVFQGEGAYTEDLGRTLRKMGVSHLLTFEPLPAGWPVTLLFRGVDPFLHRRWDRDLNSPLYLYKFEASPGRAYLTDAHTEAPAEGEVTVKELTPHRVVLDVNAKAASKLVLTDLDFPGWQARVDGQQVPSLPTEMARVVAIAPGEHEVVWTYHATSLWVGVGIAGVALLAAIAATIFMNRFH